MLNLRRKVKLLIDDYLNTHIYNYIQKNFLTQYFVFGDRTRLKISDTAITNNAIFNLSSGTITIEDYVFFGHGVSLITGTHDYQKFNLERQLSFPEAGRDIVVRQGAWIASNATILAPCTIGGHSVVAAGSLVKADVPPYTIVAGVPAKVIKTILHD
jgi:acetyltransferase-like isoleucine patch superfamily enzyme